MTSTHKLTQTELNALKAKASFNWIGQYNTEAIKIRGFAIEVRNPVVDEKGNSMRAQNYFALAELNDKHKHVRRALTMYASAFARSFNVANLSNKEKEVCLDFILKIANTEKHTYRQYARDLLWVLQKIDKNGLPPSKMGNKKLSSDDFLFLMLGALNPASSWEDLHGMSVNNFHDGRNEALLLGFAMPAYSLHLEAFRNYLQIDEYNKWTKANSALKPEDFEFFGFFPQGNHPKLNLSTPPATASVTPVAPVFVSSQQKHIFAYGAAAQFAQSQALLIKEVRATQSQPFLSSEVKNNSVELGTVTTKKVVTPSTPK